jgi:cytosine/adenosine deaminase-related metal-dependent hydrolase
MTEQTITARYVFPVDGPPLPGGIVAIASDKIAAVEPHGARAADMDLGNMAVLPGLVNAHTHLDLSGARGLIPPTDPEHFTDWLRGVIAYRRGRSNDDVQRDIRDGLAECLRSGTTLIGDITAGGASWDAIAAATVRAVVFHEVIGLDQDGVARWHQASAWARSRGEPDCRPGYSPHAPYSVNAFILMRSVECGRPVTIHMAESPGEAELLDHRRGPFVQFLRDVGAWEGGLAKSMSWVLEWTSRKQIPILYAHCNYLSPDTPLRRNQSVIYCPRTHAAFGQPPHPFRDFLRRGVRVALGTDSLASNPDLDLLAEVRFVHQRYPDVPGDTLLRMGTLAGAEALGWADETGSLTAGKSADLVAVPLPDAGGEPHQLLLESSSPVARTMFRGQWVFPA